MDSAYIPQHLDVSTISCLTHTQIHTHLPVRLQATGTLLLKPLSPSGGNTHTLSCTLLTNFFFFTQFKSCLVGKPSENNVAIMSSKGITHLSVHSMNWPSVLTRVWFNGKSSSVFQFCVSHRFSCQMRSEGSLWGFSRSGLDMSVFPLMPARWWYASAGASSSKSQRAPRPPGLSTPSGLREEMKNLSALTCNSQRRQQSH